MSAHNHNFAPAWGQGKRRVALEGRVFFVGFEPDGSPRNIVERKRRTDGMVRSETYWHRSHRLPDSGRKGRRKSVVRTVLELAGVDTRQIAAH